MRIAVDGVGAVGARVVRHLLTRDDIDEVCVDGGRLRSRGHRAEAFGSRVNPQVDLFEHGEFDVVVLATPVGVQWPRVQQLRGRARVIVTTTDAVEETRKLLAASASLADDGVAVVVGASFSPGLSCLIAAEAARRFDHLDEVHVAKLGTGGPSCARHHHRVSAGVALEWRDRQWIDRPGGSGRELCWFPEPLGAHDCFRAVLAEPLMLVDACPDVTTVTARLAATRRDRLTSWMPMLIPPPSEGGVGGIRVELRGTRDGVRVSDVFGVAERPAVAAASMASAVATLALDEGLDPGAYGVGRLAHRGLLDRLARDGVKIQRFGE